MRAAAGAACRQGVASLTSLPPQRVALRRAARRPQPRTGGRACYGICITTFCVGVRRQRSAIAANMAAAGGSGGGVRRRRHSVAAAAASPLPQPPTAWPTVFWIPNLLCYARLLVMLVASARLAPHAPLAFAAVYAAAVATDAVDGALARRLGQCSAYGAFLDVAVDNACRAVVWAHAAPGGAGALAASLEWTTFVAAHAGGGAAWKTGCFAGAPRWVAAVMSGGFRSPAGAVAVAGLNLLPLWLLLHRSGAAAAALQGWGWGGAEALAGWMALGGVLAGGRALCAAVEVWLLQRHLRQLLSASSAM